jgi:hypothetical protein
LHFAVANLGKDGFVIPYISESLGNFGKWRDGYNFKEALLLK